MGQSRIADRDNYFRHSVYPVSFRGKSFASKNLMALRDLADGSLLTSLTWQQYVPTTSYIHSYGCRMASRRNDKKRADGAYKEKNRQVYCGAYQLTGRAVRALATVENLHEISSADIIHHIEEGEIAHTDLRIVLKAGQFDIEGTKTAIVDRLWNTCTGPLRHICDCDTEIEPHPNSRLETPPAGQYFDTRSYLRRLWFFIRFQVCSWWWRKFCQNGGQ